MTMNNTLNTEPSKLVIYNRDGLIEQEHFGYVVRTDKTRVLEKIGEDIGVVIKMQHEDIFNMMHRI